MSNDFFKFKRFTIVQSHCAMKVGTDGTLLGAWARGGNNVLDVGTGTGLIALMMAQRFPQADVLGIDIDEAACRQAEANVAASPFKARIVCRGLLEQRGIFDSIVSNPPFFESSLECPNQQRTQARHTSSLSYRDLMQHTFKLLSDNGEFSLVIPANCKSRIEEEAFLSGYFKVRECSVKTTPQKPYKRYLMAFGKHPVLEVENTIGLIEESPGKHSEWYDKLTGDFYL